MNNHRLVTSQKKEKKENHRLVRLACCLSGLILLQFSFTNLLRPAPSSSITETSISKIATSTEYEAFDPDRITHVYHIGQGPPVGRSNNRIITILHAIDIALDNHGDLPNNHAVVAISNWAFEILKGMFFNGTDTDPTEFSLQLEQLRPVLLVHENRLEALGLTESNNKTQAYLITRETFYYKKRHRDQSTPQIIKKRRQAVLGALFQHGIAERNLVLYHVVLDYIKKRQIFRNETNQKIEYITVHSRWLEGSCERRVGRLLPKDECWMTPSYIKDIMGGTVDKPIVLIGDGQNKEVIDKLKNDTDIGPALIIPGDIIPDGVEVSPRTQPWSDMMIAIMGDAFIGTRVSTVATMVGVFRVVTGADPASNFIYTSRTSSSFNEQTNVEVCEDCLFFCDTDQSDMCGHDKGPSRQKVADF